MIDKKKEEVYPNKVGVLPPFPEGVIDVCWTEKTMQVYLTFADNSFTLYPPDNPNLNRRTRL
jgi:hypothetical protein